MKLVEENLNFIYENINAIFPLNLIVSNYRNSVIKRYNIIKYPESIKKEEKEIINKMTAELSRRGKEIVYHIESSKRLRYMGFGIYEGESYEGAVILGPYLKDITPSILIEESERYFYEGITIINKAQQNAIANIVVSIINTPKITHASLEKEEKNLEINRLNYTLDDYELNLDWIKERYKAERKLLHYVSQGNKEIAIELSTKDTYRMLTEINRFPENPIRNIKNLAIVFNTLLRKSIECSGVDEYFIHTTSENFALRIENGLTIRELINLMTDMVAQYCDLVNEYNTRTYSELISKAITCIKLNFKKNISLATVAKELFIHPTYLAKKFKHETGKTVSEYVNEIRIKEAQFMIMATEFKVEEIAYYVGYNDKKYFSKTFKKIIGVSPSEYRKFNKEAPSNIPLKE